MAKPVGAFSIPIDYKQVENLAYLGHSLDDIALVIGISPTQLDVRKKADNELNSAWKRGKESRKKELIKNINELSDKAKSEEVKFKANKYELSVFHGVNEKQEILHKGSLTIESKLDELNEPDTEEEAKIS